MRYITVAGPPSSGKTSVILKTIDELRKDGLACGVVKFDCLSTDDDTLYRNAGVPVCKGLSGVLCPDHYFVSNIDKVFEWSEKHAFGIVIIESAGLCNRCSPHIKNILSICVIDNLSGLHTPG